MWLPSWVIAMVTVLSWILKLSQPLWKAGWDGCPILTFQQKWPLPSVHRTTDGGPVVTNGPAQSTHLGLHLQSQSQRIYNSWKSESTNVHEMIRQDRGGKKSGNRQVVGSWKQEMMTQEQVVERPKCSSDWEHFQHPNLLRIHSW